MGSRAHSAGVGFAPRLIGQRTLASLFEAESQRRADLRPVRYYAHVGGTIHLVQDLCSETIFRVSGPANLTFARGAVVPVGSFNGLQGEFLTGFPAMGQAGGSANPVSISIRSSGFRVEGPCPSLRTGKSYLAIYRDFASTPDRLYGFLYTDGTYVSTLGFVEESGFTLPSFAGNSVQRIGPLGDTVILKGIKAGNGCLVTWNAAASTVKIAETGIVSGDMGGPIWPGTGSDMYFADISFFGGAQHVQLYRCPVGFEGIIDLPSAAVGSEYVEATGALTLPSVLYSSGVDFQIPGLWPGGDGIAVPHASLSGGWTLGEGRAIVSPTFNVNGYGYPGPGQTIIRATNFDSGNETVGRLPAGPGTPEIALFPPEWEFSSVGNLSLDPALTELVCFPVEIIGEPATADKLLRVTLPSAQVAGTCGIPYLTVEAAPPVGAVPSVMLART